MSQLDQSSESGIVSPDNMVSHRGTHSLPEQRKISEFVRGKAALAAFIGALSGASAAVVGCGGPPFTLDTSGTGPDLVDSGEGGDAAGGDAHVDVDSGKVDVDAGGDVQIDSIVPDVLSDGSDSSSEDAADGGFEASVDASGDADAAPGCTDIPVKFHDMAGYALRVYGGGICTEAEVKFSNYVNGATTLSGSTVDLCLKKGDVVVAQVEDPSDTHALEFDSGSVPGELRLRDISSSTPITYNVNRAMCSSLSGWLTVDAKSFDLNPAATGYKYNGKTGSDGGVAESSGFYVKF